jgi:hypothetical protein
MGLGLHLVGAIVADAIGQNKKTKPVLHYKKRSPFIVQHDAGWDAHAMGT